ncbi:MAG: ATPase [Eubacterium sp.]|nr:ATPase [Eubacterium sp.]
MTKSKIEQLLDELADYIDGCKGSKLAPNRVTIDRDVFYEIFEDLQSSIPEEISRYQKIIQNKDKIIEKAQEEASVMVSEAQTKTERLLDENEMVQEAYRRAEEIMAQAQAEAEQIVGEAVAQSDEIRKSALVYTSDLLGGAGKNIEAALNEFETKSTMLISALKMDAEEIRNNRAELQSQIEGQDVQPEEVAAPSEESIEEITFEPVNPEE